MRAVSARQRWTELAVAAVALGAVACVGEGPRGWVGALAVCLSFAFAQEATNGVAWADHDAHARRLNIITVAKESAWIVYFVWGHSWTALVGSALFLGLPAWRSWTERRARDGR